MGKGQEAAVALWVEALESGKYKQTTGQLARELKDGSVGHCCLGVGCEVYNAHHREPVRWKYQDGDLPLRVRNWLGLSDSLGRVSSVDAPLVTPRGKTFRSLAEANDKRTSFKSIAAIIKSRPEGLFK